jgi:CheY-like chemotaxis protein
MDAKRILVVEDDPETRASLRDLLVRNGYRVQTASNGHEALGRLLDEEQPSLIVLDLRMPVMDGPQLLTITRAYHRLASIPVLVVTAAGLPQLTVESILEKPFRPDELLAHVERLTTTGARGLRS